ncbi:tRNA (guanine-N(7)-)-methyltransferase non-catalytic subunit trm82 [Lecanosticta acicola]|uniref:tRNA (Guanine-N(7)-)-methyltransferase non-catalytic subunit trm82 n=1 Tax=Lecanosticta acicola TaxID=111012 RepID=A0AAI9ECR5_9PEZI|nr:tRNA (guanine-N(7)-)-methyltransferase non-catalytic subunit trm82 [Lecanosticta acicola]
MLHPYQCLAAIGQEYLVAACGPRLLVLGLDHGRLISDWTSEDNSPEVGRADSNGAQQRPAKKQKTGTASAKAPNVIRLTVSEDQHHVVAVTDDKFVRVFEQESGVLAELSQRCMPKRPCAVQIMPDNATILIGDKFGDVYSIPLLPSEASEAAAAKEQSTPQPASTFKASATNLTVHTARNLKALEAQTKQKDFTPRKEPLKFEHELLLGHVAMLTDMKYLLKEDGGKEKGYILTADRDEHIRISRGPPQSHVIEGYCLGHTEFISKICQVGETNLLVSGGGDGWLGVWDWPEYKLRKKIDLLGHVRDTNGHQKDDQVAVSGIWSMSIDAAGGMDMEDVILVACDKIKALYIFPLSYLEADPAQHEKSEFERPVITEVPFEGCPLDVVVSGDRAIVSVDQRQNGKKRIQTFWPRKKGAEGDPLAPVLIEQEEEEGIEEQLKTLNDYRGPEKDVTHKELDGLLYGVAEMRKRRDQPEGGDNEERAQGPEDQENGQGEQQERTNYAEEE